MAGRGPAWMALLAVAAATILACAAPRTATAAAADTREITVQTPDGPRQVILAGTQATDPAPRPVVLLFHGHGGSAAQVLGTRGLAPSPLTQWLQIAQREPLIIASLEGERGSDGRRGWNDCRDDAASSPQTDDVAFARAVVAWLLREAHADPTRIYAMGMSNGGMMMFRLGVQMPELVAFAAVSASMASDSRCAESPRKDVAAFIISGDADPLVPFGGGQVRLGPSAPRGGVIAVPETYARWARAHGQDPAASTETRLAPVVEGDATQGVLRYTGATLAQSDVALLRIVGGGHVEPSAAHRYGPLYLSIVGPQSSVAESAELAWEFFRAKRRP